LLVVDAGDAEAASSFLEARGETVYLLGEIRPRETGQEQTLIL
jgi:phosphoribosylaminoimidazole (AIR) synthetase